MNLLLDTHVFLWLLNEPEKLSRTARAACEQLANNLYLSVASTWEMQIKSQLGKLELPAPLERLITEQQEQNGLRIVPVELNHVLALANLPSHHKDPFDRLLIAQARVEVFQLVSADGVFRNYEVQLLW
jgi:PIN domain nuclease of toxin-antitoxin system